MVIKKKLSIFADGGSRGNPGPAAVGFVIKEEKGKTLIEKGIRIGQATNNVAEYTAVIKALKWISKNVNDEISLITFFLDSKLVVNQLNGFYKIKNHRLRNLVVEVRQGEREVGGNVSYQFVPREKNKKADWLVNQSFKVANSF